MENLHLLCNNEYFHCQQSPFTSCFNTTSPSLPRLFLFMWCNTSKATNTLSVMLLPDTKANWFSVITPGSIAFSLFASTLASSLYSTLQSVIGRRSFMVSALSFLGINTTLLLFISARKEKSRSQSSQHWKILCPISAQKCWKKQGSNHPDQKLYPDASVLLQSWIPHK